MRLDQQIREAKSLQDQLSWLEPTKSLQDQLSWLEPTKSLQDQLSWLEPTKSLQDQLSWLEPAKSLQDQLSWLEPAKSLQDQLSWLEPAKSLQDQLSWLEPAKSLQDQLSWLEPAKSLQDQLSWLEPAKSLQDQLSWLEPAKSLQDVEDRISRLTNFSHNLFPFVEKYAEELLKEEAVSEQNMTDEVKKQVEDLFKELENEEVADEVEFLERFWRKVVEGWGKIPDWSKNCLVMIIWSIFHMYLSAYLNVLFQISYQAANPTTIVHKPVTAIIKKAERQGLHLPPEYRIVIARVLNVREKPTRHSGIRGKLLAADIIVIKKKKKNWSLVEYSNEETGVKIQGWVFTRYLRKIN